MINERRIGVDSEMKRLWPNLRYNPDFRLKGFEENHEKFVRLVHVPANIQIGNLRNRSE
jgi:hypothetical protein